MFCFIKLKFADSFIVVKHHKRRVHKKRNLSEWAFLSQGATNTFKKSCEKNEMEIIGNFRVCSVQIKQKNVRGTKKVLEIESLR
jgi:hypothetical protein